MKDDNSVLWILHFAKQCKGKMIASVILAMLGSVSGMIPYFAVSIMIQAIYEGDFVMNKMVFLAFVAFLGYLGKTWFSVLSTILSHRSAFLILKSIRSSLSEKLSRMPMGKILDTPSGKYKTILVDTVEKLELPLAHLIPELTANILIPIFILIYLFVLDFRVALFSLITIPIGMFCYMGMMKDYQTRYARVLTAGKNMDVAIVEYIGGIEVIKTFRQSEVSYQKYSDAVKENKLSKSDWFLKTNPYYTIGIAIMPSCLLGVLPMGSFLFVQGSLSAPTFITSIILSMSLVKPLIQALEYTDSLAMVDSTVKEVAMLLKEEELQRPEQSVKLTNHVLEFSNVSFAYDEQQVLSEVSFTIKPSTITAIVGPSGSGKSTIARLIASFWESSSGEITVGGFNLKNIPLRQAMEIVSYVSQENFLFNRTIRENIRLGNSKASDEEIEYAAKKAGCHDFIMSLPQGYDTKAGDCGNALSGGERQRITIARAILKDSPIIVLDEATSFTDPENEALIQESLNALIKDKTLIVIAHRLGTIVGADQILVMDKGRLTDIGNHEELLKCSNLYQTLWKAYDETRSMK